VILDGRGATVISCRTRRADSTVGGATHSQWAARTTGQAMAQSTTPYRGEAGADGHLTSIAPAWNGPYGANREDLDFGCERQADGDAPSRLALEAKEPLGRVQESGSQDRVTIHGDLDHQPQIVFDDPASPIDWRTPGITHQKERAVGASL
jgi:hypothetical protein